MGENISLDELFHQHMHSSAVTNTVTVNGTDFELLHVKLRAGSLADHSIAYCADNRLVLEEKLARRIPGLHGKLADANGEFFYICYVSFPAPQGFLGHLIAREYSQEECRNGEARSRCGSISGRPPGSLRRRRTLIWLPHFDTPPASTLSQSSVQGNPGAQDDLDQQAALDSLRQDLERLRDIAGKHEFTPLAPELRAAFVRDVQAFAPSFLRADISIQITHETWSPPATQQYVAQLASLLREGGLQVQGPDQITYFLVTPASPIEWGYHDRDIPHIEVLYQALLKVIRPNTKWTKASHQEHGSIRIHFGGQVVFEPNGMVAVL